MFEDLTRCLGWGSNYLPDGLLLINSEGTDGGFLIHHFISLYLKRQLPLCLVTLAQTFSHYAQAGIKTGVNLDKAKSDGLVCHIDLATQFSRNFLEASEHTGATPHHTMQDLFSDIKHRVVLMKSKLHSNQQAPVLIIDDLSLLAAFRTSTDEMKDFVHYLNILSKSLHFLIVTVMPTFATDDYQSLQAYVTHHANTVIKVNGLPSGYSKDVHGHLQMYQGTDGATSSIWQYKLSDKNLHLFAIGTSSAVL